MLRRTLSALLFATLVAAPAISSIGIARAEEPAARSKRQSGFKTVKGGNESFTELSKVAREGTVTLGERKRGGVPELAELETADIVVAAQQLSSSQVQAVVTARAAEVQYCYEKHMRKVKQASGEVAVSFVIAPSGKVGNIKVEVAGPSGKGLSSCIAQRVKKWQFPQADLATEVTIPFIFAVAGTTPM